tara:strand:+ start:191 stop:514 length:324 start_codon:yes stop_codon:yes gene_type:complete
MKDERVWSRAAFKKEFGTNGVAPKQEWTGERKKRHIETPAPEGGVAYKPLDVMSPVKKIRAKFVAKCCFCDGWVSKGSLLAWAIDRTFKAHWGCYEHNYRKNNKSNQ